MSRCLELARIGAGSVAPNPMVGAVIVHNDQIIGEGYHMKYGEAHAEVNAFNAVQDESLLQDSTLYVNLEPCAHYGKTPPCCDLVIQKKVKRVVVGCLDSYEQVDGEGIKRIKQAGIETAVGVLEKESLDLNRRFFTFHSKKRPYIILKWAQSSDGFIDIDRSKDQRGIHWITHEATKKLTHQWRHEEAAILVGNKTIAIDNPRLTCRAVEGNSPIRIVLDRKLKLDYGAFHVGDRSVLTYIVSDKEVVSNGNLQFVQPTDFTAHGVMDLLYRLNIQSVIIEGGKTTFEEFISIGLWDEARILTGAQPMNDGVKAPVVKGIEESRFLYGEDEVLIVRHA